MLINNVYSQSVTCAGIMQGLLLLELSGLVRKQLMRKIMHMLLLFGITRGK